MCALEAALIGCPAVSTSGGYVTGIQSQFCILAAQRSVSWVCGVQTVSVACWAPIHDKKLNYERDL